jgi:hypothetical protein
MLTVDSEPSTPANTSTPTHLSPPSLQAELDLWNLLASSLGMDKRSQPRSQLPTGSTRRGRPNSAHHSANVPSTQASAVPSSSSVRQLSLLATCPPDQRYNNNTHCRPLFRVTLDRSRDGIHNSQLYPQVRQETSRRWLVLYALYRTPIRF